MAGRASDQNFFRVPAKVLLWCLGTLVDTSEPSSKESTTSSSDILKIYPKNYKGPFSLFSERGVSNVFGSLTGALAVQQRTDNVAALPRRVSAGRHAHAAHPGGVRRGRRPLLGPGRERRRQSDLLGAPGRRRRVADPAARRVAARDAAQAGGSDPVRAPAGGARQEARPAAAAAVLPRGNPRPGEAGAGIPARGRHHRAARAAGIRRAAAGHRRPGGNPRHVRGLRARQAGTDDPVVPRGTTADGRRRLRDIVPGGARAAVHTGGLPGRRRALSVQR